MVAKAGQKQSNNLHLQQLTFSVQACALKTRPLASIGIGECSAHGVDRNSRYQAREEEPGKTNCDRNCARKRWSLYDIASREFPQKREPTFAGYSIGRWLDTDGDGRCDMLEVETRNIRGPRVGFDRRASRLNFAA